MRLTHTLLCVLTAFSFELGAATPTPFHGHSFAPSPSSDMQGKCTQKLQRRAWQNLSRAEKKAYLDAELCLMSLPTKTGLPAAVTRFDDLIKAHQMQAYWVHGDGWFLPFHRLLMSAHELLLRQECGYAGAQPYWEETVTVGKVSTCELLDPVYGFGGGGTGPGGCISDGPFKDYVLHTGPGEENTVQCIHRNVSDTNSWGSSQANVTECLQKPSFATAWPCLEKRPHWAGHNAIGGEVANPISSPGDPLFYLHHTWLDKLWWNWQALDLPARLEDIAGHTSSVKNPALPADYSFVNATLDDVLDMYGVVANATVRDVMDIRGERLCFEYVEYQPPAEENPKKTWWPWG
ncbi:hypothetical protein FN846DRAFT_953684 [Sphaerosporella brunnea]|uniref:Tyrosinase copper-binding domain-containing protein n=1 Tax=Sphaerosporella brunnea TaxID=1250544 RepID=A0A5J5ETR7_9PEZI|nr:hypothetical protein FN846DRAFT_953684 [Sphaerosporella brunnea]